MVQLSRCFTTGLLALMLSVRVKSARPASESDVSNAKAFYKHLYLQKAEISSLPSFQYTANITKKPEEIGDADAFMFLRPLHFAFFEGERFVKLFKWLVGVNDSYVPSGEVIRQRHFARQIQSKADQKAILNIGRQTEETWYSPGRDTSALKDKSKMLCLMRLPPFQPQRRKIGKVNKYLGSWAYVMGSKDVSVDCSKDQELSSVLTNGGRLVVMFGYHPDDETQFKSELEKLHNQTQKLPEADASDIFYDEMKLESVDQTELKSLAEVSYLGDTRNTAGIHKDASRFAFVRPRFFLYFDRDFKVVDVKQMVQEKPQGDFALLDFGDPLDVTWNAKEVQNDVTTRAGGWLPVSFDLADNGETAYCFTWMPPSSWRTFGGFLYLISTSKVDCMKALSAEGARWIMYPLSNN